MKIALIQMNPTVGDIEGNKNKIIEKIKSVEADLLIFPELVVTGYCPQDLILKKGFIDQNLEAVKDIASVSKKNVVLGFIDKSHGGHVLNAAALISNGVIKDVYHKVELPNYSVFDEKRWFLPCDNIGIYEIKDKRFALTICEDIWTEYITKNQSKYDPDMYVNISASPYSATKIKEVEDLLIKRNKDLKKPILYVNQVGGQDGIVYFGHSMYVENEEVKWHAKDFEEDVLIVDYDR